jgi:MSHA biogenesis protein MshE
VTGDETIEHEWVPIGTLLLRRGLIDVEQLELALTEREQSGCRLGELLVSFGWVSSRDVAIALAEQFQLPFRDLAAAPATADASVAAELLPGELADELDAVVLEVTEDHLLVGVGDPTDIGAIERLRDGLDRPLELVVIDAAQRRPARLPNESVTSG